MSQVGNLLTNVPLFLIIDKDFSMIIKNKHFITMLETLKLIFILSKYWNIGAILPEY